MTRLAILVIHNNVHNRSYLSLWIRWGFIVESSIGYLPHRLEVLHRRSVRSKIGGMWNVGREKGNQVYRIGNNNNIRSVLDEDEGLEPHALCARLSPS